MTDRRNAQAPVDALTPEIVATALREFKRTHSHMELMMRAESVLELASALHLAKRHPQIGDHPTVLAAIERFLTGAREYFADCAPVLEVLRQGDDPRYDQ